MGNGGTPTHWFVVETYDSSTGECTKYDMGMDERIQTHQPFRTQLDEWDNKDFICAYRVDYAPAGDIVVPDKDGLGERRDITDSTLDKDNNNLVNRMQKSLRGSSYSNLSYLIIPHYNFDGQVVNGEMVVCRELADEVLLIFQELYKVKYPIEKMELVDNFGDADDWISIQNNNTSAFNYRHANNGQTESDALSNHAFGKSIDINPLINPYIINYYSASESPYTTHNIENGPNSRDSSRNYGDRFIYRDQMTGWKEIEKQARIARGTNIYNIFTKYGWSWLEHAGGSGEDLDSQHFDKQDTSNVKRIDYSALSSSQNGRAQDTTNSASNDARKILFIGDSRTEDIERTVSSDATFICKVGEGYNWMKDTAFPEADTKVYAGIKVIIWLGVNDYGNINNYIEAVNNQASIWASRGAAVYYVEVGPVDSDPYINNEQIEDFNRKLQEGLSSNVRLIKLYDKLKNEGYTTVDGTHYNSATTQKIYDYLVNSVNGMGSVNGTVTETPFTKYQLTDHELTGLAAVAFSEQGTPRGAAVEASLMANLFETHYNSECYGVTGGEGLYKMVSQPIGAPYGWFADASNYIESGQLAPYCGGGPVTEEMKAVVKRVLVDGYRTLPLYIDEHDSWSGKDYRAYLNGEDVTNDRNSYIPFTTHIVNDYNSEYTFWGWADPTYDSDAFGYTSEENRAKYGDFCYDFDGNPIGNPGTATAGSDTKYYVKVATWNQTITNVEYNEPGKDGYTTVANNMTSKNINYQDFLSGYTMPFNYLWAMLVITEDKDFVLELADLIYNSELEITVHDNYSENTSQSSESYWTTFYVKKGPTDELSPERAMFTKTTTTTYKNNRIETALTRANVWIVDYKQDFVYETLSNGSKWVAKEKTTREKTDKNDTKDNFVTLLRKHSKAYRTLNEDASWLFEVIENPDNGITDMLDLTKYLLYKATGTKYDNIDTYDFGAYDPSTFKKSTDGFVGSNLEEKLWWLLKDIGYTDYAAAGAMGNFSAETDDGKEINSGCVESNGEGIGIVQWSFGRKQALLAYAESKGKTWENETIQLEFLKAELTGGGCDGFAEDQCYDKATETRFLAASSPEEAADLFDKLFERSGASRLEVRERGAKYYYNMFHGKARPAYVGGSSEIIEVADKYVGNPYVWGGSSLTNGCDCSHFVWLVLKECGKIPQDAAYHYTGEIYSGGLVDWGAEYIGKDPNDAVAGDIVLYADGNIHHVALYDGNGLIVEAKGSAWGITHDRTIDHEPIAGIYRVK